LHTAETRKKYQPSHGCPNISCGQERDAKYFSTARIRLFASSSCWIYGRLPSPHLTTSLQTKTQNTNFPVQFTPENRQSDFEANLIEESESIVTESPKSQLGRLTAVSINGTLRSARIKVVSPKDLSQRSPGTIRERPSINGDSPSRSPSLPLPLYGSFFSIPLVEDPVRDAGHVSLLGQVVNTGA